MDTTRRENKRNLKREIERERVDGGEDKEDGGGRMRGNQEDKGDGSLWRTGEKESEQIRP